MPKDWKIGMVLGSIIGIVATLWLSTHTTLRTTATRQHSHGVVSLKDTQALSDNLITNRPNAENADSNQLPIIDNQSNLLEIYVNEQPEKIKTQKFHIVRKGETLSEISYKYYGSANKWQKILDANRNVIKDANKLNPGTKLIIPD